MKTVTVMLLGLVSFLGCSSQNKLQHDQQFSIALDGFIQSCAWNPLVSVKDHGIWRARLNPFNSSRGGLCYLDDNFLPLGLCDFSTCQKIDSLGLLLVEYVEVGTKLAPPEAGQDLIVPMYRTVPLHGEIKIQINYSVDSTCINEKTITITVTR